jgi:hypothetical protein
VADGKDNGCDRMKDEDCGIITSAGRMKSAIKIDIPSEKLEAWLWPNPARTELIVGLESFAPNRKLEMVLMTAEGRSLKAESLVPKVKGQQVKFDVRTFVSGNYFSFDTYPAGKKRSFPYVLVKYFY